MDIILMEMVNMFVLTIFGLTLLAMAISGAVMTKKSIQLRWGVLLRYVLLFDSHNRWSCIWTLLLLAVGIISAQLPINAPGIIAAAIVYIAINLCANAISYACQIYFEGLKDAQKQLAMLAVFPMGLVVLSPLAQTSLVYAGVLLASSALLYMMFWVLMLHSVDKTTIGNQSIPCKTIIHDSLPLLSLLITIFLYCTVIVYALNLVCIEGGHEAAFVFTSTNSVGECPKDLFTAFYFVITCMSTTGFGDIVPNSSGGRAMAIIVMLSGMGYLGWYVHAFSQVRKVQNCDEK